MDTLFTLTFYASCFGAPATFFAAIVYTFKYFRSEALREKSHYEVCALVMFLMFWTFLIMLLLTYSI